MSGDNIQAKYEDLAGVARRLAQQSQAAADLRSRITRSTKALEQGGWIGRGSTAFFAEMNSVVFPALQRLILALEEARAVTLQASEIMRIAEEEAAALFKGNGAALGATNPFSSPLGWASDGAPGDGGLSPASPWATAPFAAGASVLGPGPVPVLGPRGRVPAGYTNAGKRLWLYIGGSGPDTIFSVHPQAGLGRAPFKLPKPNLRLDYGPINTKTGLAYLPGGRAVSVPAGLNFFHWNMQGGMGQINQPLFKTIGGAITNDHQLLTTNPVPRGNVAGTISGAKIVRGASRGLFVVGAGLDVYNIATAEDKARETSKVAGGWAGAWGGAKGGAAIGAGIGTFFGPGPGTAIGGAVGGVVGGIGGYVAGSAIGEKLYDLF
ncbi:MAG TPA: WXG100 family type VII secretion target [Herpetosiphonaceae bacterium]